VAVQVVVRVWSEYYSVHIHVHITYANTLVPSSNDTMDDNKTEEYITSKVLAVFLD
jgi:hypothetical protein